MSRCVGATRWLWNHLLDMQQRRHRESGEFIFRSQMSSMLPTLKNEHGWLRDVPSPALQRVCRDLDLALRDTFRPRKGGRKGFPKFKAKYGSKASFYVSNQPLRIDGGRVILQKIGAVRFRAGRLPPGKLMSATIEFDGASWWCTIQCQTARDAVPVSPIPETVLGIDMGLAELVVASDGQRVSASRPLRRAMRRLARAQRILARRRKGSERRKRQAALVRRLHVRVRDCRLDLLHKTSRSLVDRASALVVEDLNVRGMMANRRLALSAADAGLGKLRQQLTYKLQRDGKTLVVADRFFPSTQACSACGNVLTGESRLSLKQRTYRCDCCGHVMDRDLNAAHNLRRYGLQSLGLLSPGIITVGQAMPEPAGIRIAPPPYARRESAAGPSASALGRHDSSKRELSNTEDAVGVNC